MNPADFAQTLLGQPLEPSQRELLDMLENLPRSRFSVSHTPLRKSQFPFVLQEVKGLPDNCIIASSGKPKPDGSNAVVLIIDDLEPSS